jgi:hypothetical protein
MAVIQTRETFCDLRGDVSTMLEWYKRVSRRKRETATVRSPPLPPLPSREIVQDFDAVHSTAYTRPWLPMKQISPREIVSFDAVIGRPMAIDQVVSSCCDANFDAFPKRWQLRERCMGGVLPSAKAGEGAGSGRDNRKRKQPVGGVALPTVDESQVGGADVEAEVAAAPEVKRRRR